MYQRSNVLHERQDDNMQFSVPILIGGRWVRCDRGRRLFPSDSHPEIESAENLLKREGDSNADKWNFNFFSESPRADGEWEWIPREVIVRSTIDGIEDGENENGDVADDDDDDGDLQVVESQRDSEDDSDGSPEIKRARIIHLDNI